MYVHIYVYIYVHVYRYTCMYIFIHIYILYIHIYIHIRIYIYVRVSMDVHIYTSIHQIYTNHPSGSLCSNTLLSRVLLAPPRWGLLGRNGRGPIGPPIGALSCWWSILFTFCWKLGSRALPFGSRSLPNP